jgi:hypothetical protein
MVPVSATKFPIYVLYGGNLSHSSPLHDIPAAPPPAMLHGGVILLTPLPSTWGLPQAATGAGTPGKARQTQSTGTTGNIATHP